MNFVNEIFILYLLFLVWSTSINKMKRKESGKCSRKFPGVLPGIADTLDILGLEVERIEPYFVCNVYTIKPL